MFKGLKHLSKALKLLSKALKHKFKALEWKKSSGENKNPSRGKRKFLPIFLKKTHTDLSICVSFFVFSISLFAEHLP